MKVVPNPVPAPPRVLLALPPELCPHWWKIKEPSGPVSKARCKLCGAKRKFDNGYYLQGKVEAAAVHTAAIKISSAKSEMED